jgi:hypothetical protein
MDIVAAMGDRHLIAVPLSLAVGLTKAEVVARPLTGMTRPNRSVSAPLQRGARTAPGGSVVAGVASAQMLSTHWSM